MKVDDDVCARPAAEAARPPVPVLSMTGICKTFGGAHALQDVSLDLVGGRVHALVGMNGAGKSTLVGVMSGAHVPDAGTIEIDGTAHHGLTPRRARELGVATVPQRRDLVGSMSVAENIVLGDLPRRLGVVDHRRVRREALDALAVLGLAIDPDRLAGDLGAAEQTMVEIAREVRRGGRVLILDEPTATLGGDAATQVRALVRRLRDQGLAIVYISHHLEEITELADRVTVLRDGCHQLTTDVADLDVARLVYAMAGEHVDTERPVRERTPGAPLLALDGLQVGDRLRDLDLEVRAGEVVAVLGPAGDGQSALFDTLAGTLVPDDGTLRVRGLDVRWGSVGASLASGLRCVTGDRHALGLVGDLGVDENVLLAQDRAARRRFVRWRDVRRRAADLRRRFGVVTLTTDPPVSSLSGGNQQKVLLAKWLESEPEIVFLEEPTNGVDVAAKAEIHRVVDALVDGGTGVLLASSDVAEVLRLADRVVVVSAGRVVAERDATATRDELIALTVGGTQHARSDV